MGEYFNQGVCHLVVLDASQGLDLASIFPGSWREQQEVAEGGNPQFCVGGLCSRSHSTQGGNGLLQIPQVVHGLEREIPKEVHKEPKYE